MYGNRDTDRTIRPGQILNRRRFSARHGCGFDRLVVGEQGQWVGGVQLSTGSAAAICNLDRMVNRHWGCQVGGEVSNVFVDEAGMERAVHKLGPGQDLLQEPDVGGNPANPKLAQGAATACSGGGQVSSPNMGNDLGQQRVKCRSDLIARVAKAIGSDPWAARYLIVGEYPARWANHAVGSHGLGVDSRLDCYPSRCRAFGQAKFGQRTPFGQPDLGLHQINAGHLLGNRVLHL